MSGVIYIITTGYDAYVGSTNNFRTRISHHKYNIYNKNSKDYNAKVYKKIRENNGEWDICIYEDNLSLNKKELYIYEEKVRVLLGATLNSIRAYATEEQLRQQAEENGAVPIKCECDCFVRRGDIARHRKSTKHINLMISLEQNAKAELPRTFDSE